MTTLPGEGGGGGELPPPHKRTWSHPHTTGFGPLIEAAANVLLLSRKVRRLWRWCSHGTVMGCEIAVAAACVVHALGDGHVSAAVAAVAETAPLEGGIGVWYARAWCSLSAAVFA